MCAAWYVRFAGQIISRTGTGADGLTAVQLAFQRPSHPRAMTSAWGEKDLAPGSEQEEDTNHGQVFGRCLHGHNKKICGVRPLEHLLVVWYAEMSSGGLVRTPQIQSFSTAFVEQPREQPVRIDAGPVHAGPPPPPPPISTEPSKPSRVYIPNSVELARYQVHPWMYWR